MQQAGGAFRRFAVFRLRYFASMGVISADLHRAVLSTEGDIMKITITVAALAAMLLHAGPTPAAPTTEQKCEASKNGTLGKYAACLHKVQQKFVIGGKLDTVGRDAALLACSTKYSDKWQTAEAKATKAEGVCVDSAADSSFKEFLDACVSSAEDALGGARLPADVKTCNGALAAFAYPQLTQLRFQSTVTAAFDAPAGVAQGDKVTFSVAFSIGQATPASPINAECAPAALNCHEGSWTFAPPIPYMLAYSSGYFQVGQIDRIQIIDRPSPSEDNLLFYDGSTNLWQATSDPSWFTGPIPGDFATAISEVDQPGRFELTFFWGDGSGWSTYHYDYGTPQVSTIVTRTP